MSASSPAATSAQTSGMVSCAGGGSVGLGQLGRRATTTDGIDRPVVDDRQQPGLHASPSLDVAGGIPPRTEERVLDDVLGEGGVIRDAVGDRVGHRLVSVVQLIESIELTIGQAHEHGPVRVVRGGRGSEPGRRFDLVHSEIARREGFRFTDTDQAVGGRGDRPRHVVGRIGRVDDREPPGLRRGKGEESVADAAMEGEVELGLEPGDVAGCLARKAILDRQVEEDRQVGLEAVGRGRLELAESLERHACPEPLVGQRRIGEAGADDRSTGADRRADHLADQLPPRGVEEQGVGQRIGRGGRPGPRQEDLADAFAEPRAARLAGEMDVETGSGGMVGEMVGEGDRLGGLAGALRPFDRDEPAAWGGGTIHGPSVADTLVADPASSMAPGRAYPCHDQMPHDPGRHLMTTTSTRPSRQRSNQPTRPAAALAVIAAVLALLAVPAVAAAHPLGNFTINHYGGVRIEPERVLLDVVVDQAEIPTFQARLDFDTDTDGEVSDEEADAGRVVACQGLLPSLELALDGRRLDLKLVEAGLTFPPGVGGLSTMRMVCGFDAVAGSALAAGAHVTFADTSFPDRLGWREIVVTGSGVRVAAGSGELRATSPSARLTAYPTNLLAQGLHDAGATVVVTPGGPALPALAITDASPVPGGHQIGASDAAASGDHGGGEPAGGSGASPAVTEPPTAQVANVGPGGSVPGGVGTADLPAIFRATDLSPVVLLISLLTAAALGAGHALTPGHGKTLMAAYLVGTRGTPLHAAGLGLSVTVSHTLGILVLAALIVGAEGVLSPDVVVRAAPVVAAISILGIGGWMLAGEVRRRRRASASERAHRAAHERGDEHDHAHEHDHAEAQGSVPGDGDAHDLEPAAGTHSHGGGTHSHLPAAGATITWRGLFALGLAGGLIPSTSALLILLGSIAAGRPAFGFVLVVAFGLGMALVMGGIGLGLVLARGRLDRLDAGSPMGRAGSYVPLAAACLVLALGVWLTVQAVGGPPAL